MSRLAYLIKMRFNPLSPGGIYMVHKKPIFISTLGLREVILIFFSFLGINSG